MTTKEQILDSLKGVIDPEIGINIVDLGLIYEAAERDGEIFVRMTMTTAACPMGDFLYGQVQNTLRQKFREAKSVNVEMVWDPPWNPNMMSAGAKKILGR